MIKIIPINTDTLIWRPSEECQTALIRLQTWTVSLSESTQWLWKAIWVSGVTCFPGGRFSDIRKSIPDIRKSFLNIGKLIISRYRQFEFPILGNNSRSQWGGGALRVKISRGAPLEVQNGTQQDLSKMIDLVNLGGKKSVYMLKMWGFEMGPNKIWIK